MEMEKFYVAPEVEILEVEVEKGFAGSVVDGSGNVGAPSVDDGGAI